MCRLERRFPGFAGAVTDPQEDELILLFARRSPEVDVQAVQQALAEAGIAAVGEPTTARVAFPFCRLKRWHDRLSHVVMGFEDVVMTDIDEARNRLVVGVVKHADGSREDIKRAARRIGIPSRILEIEQMRPFTIGG